MTNLQRPVVVVVFLVTTLLLQSCYSTQGDVLLPSENQQCGGEKQCIKDGSTIDRLSFENDNAYPYVHANARYDIWNCPERPPFGYPHQWEATQILKDWHPDNTTIPTHIHQGLCVFDYHADYLKATKYLEADLPFVMVNTPDFAEAAHRWHDSGYVGDLLGNETTYPLYTSSSNQFLYWRRLESPPEGWKPPTAYSRVTYQEFRDIMEDRLPNETHYYMYADGHWSSSDKDYRWPLFEEFPRFKPGNTDLYHELFHQDYQTLYFKFGMKGNTAVMHFDQQRNTIVMIQGQRRYLLADPTQCPKLYLHDRTHPSNRHTTLDLRDFPENNSAMMNEVLLQPGDALILPSFWFHSVIGLTSENVQVNAWSTATANRKRAIQECGDIL